MSPPTPTIPNPLLQARQRLRLALGIAAPLVMACAWWSLKPLDAPAPIETPELAIAARDQSESSEQQAPIDPNVFALKLWNPAPNPPKTVQTAEASPTSPPAPQPLNIQLIGIITDMVDGQPVQKAAMYDGDADRLLIIADGQRLREHIVRVLPSGVVELVDGQTTRQYRLRTDRNQSPRGSM